MTEPGSYTIEILSFSRAQEDRAAAGLAKVFGIAEEKAQRLVSRVPVKVRSGAPREETLRYLKALLSLGAEVRIHGSTGQRIYRPDDGGNPGASFTGAFPAIVPSPEIAAAYRPAIPKPSAPPPPPPSVQPEPSRTPPLARVTCPKCGLEQPASTTCGRCGIVFAKYTAAQSRASGTTGRFTAITPPGPAAPSAVPTIPERSTDPYVLSPGDDDGLFRDRRRAFDPTPLMRLESGAAMASGAFPAAEPRAPSGSTTAPGSYSAPGMAIHRPTGMAAQQTRGSSDVGFWDKVGPAALYNIGDQSYQWLLLLAVLGGGSWLMSYIAQKVPVFSLQIPCLFFIYVFFAAFLSCQWRVFHNAFVAGVRGERGGQPPITELYDFKSEFVFPGYVLSLGALVVWAPFFYTVIKSLTEVSYPSQTQVILFVLLPLIYWPMAMALVSTSGRMTEVFIVTGVVRGIAIGGLEYAFVAALGVAAFFGVSYLTQLAAEVKFYHWALLYVVLGYVSGLQGFLIGSLLRRRPRMIAGVIVTEKEADA